MLSGNALCNTLKHRNYLHWWDPSSSPDSSGIQPAASLCPPNIHTLTVPHPQFPQSFKTKAVGQASSVPAARTPSDI